MTLLTRNCLSCESTSRHTVLFSTYYSHVLLDAEDQTWLGRCIIVPKRHISSFRHMSLAERKDVYECREKVSQAYQRFFGMISDQWVQKDNCKHVDDHIHYHLIPIYTKTVTYRGRVFENPKDDSHQKVVLTSAELKQLAADIQLDLLAHGKISPKNLQAAQPSKQVIIYTRDLQKIQSISDWIYGLVTAALTLHTSRL